MEKKIDIFEELTQMTEERYNEFVSCEHDLVPPKFKGNNPTKVICLECRKCRLGFIYHYAPVNLPIPKR